MYQNTFRTPDYFWFDPHTLELQGFHLVDGSYQGIQPTEQGWLWSQQLELYLGLVDNKLRFFSPQGELIPSPEELAEQERQRAEQEQQRAEQERQRAEREQQRADQERQRAERAEEEIARLKAQLRSQGLEPDCSA